VTEVRFLDLDSLLSLVKTLGVGPVRDVGLLASALGRPQARVFGEDAYPSMELKAAALMQSVAGNHALVDGNKRLAWLSTVVFLDINGWEPDLTQDEAFDLVVEVAAGLRDVEVIAARLRVAQV
jgi:death-on-curing protein